MSETQMHIAKQKRVPDVATLKCKKHIKQQTCSLKATSRSKQTKEAQKKTIIKRNIRNPRNSSSSS
jgi:hypothetical protein